MENAQNMEKDPAGIWNAAMEILKKQSQACYNQFFSNIVPVKLEDDTIILGVPASLEFLGEVVSDTYNDLLESSLLKAAKTPMKYKIIAGLVSEKNVPEEKKQPETASEIPDKINPEKIPVVTAPEPSVPLQADPNASTRAAIMPRNTFENFVVGEGNRYAYTCAEAAAKRPGTYNPLYIYGGTGMGKTHLMHAVANYVLANDPKSRICYIPSENFLNDFVNAGINHTYTEFREYYRTLDLLLIDDVHNLGGKQQLQEEFFNTFNSIYNHGGQIILSSDKLPQEIPGLEARLVSRFQLGVTTQITEPSYETRLAILKVKQNYQSIKLPPSLLSFIAERVTSQVRALEGALARIIAFCTSWNRPPETLTPPMLEGLLGDILDSEASAKHVDIDKILSVTAEQYDVHVHDIVGTKRPKNIAQARMVAMYLARTLTDLSLKEIGQAFGGRNHTTVIHAVNEIEKDLKTNEQLQHTVSQLKRKLHADL